MDKRCSGKAFLLVTALSGLIFGLAPQLLVYFSIGFIHQMFALLLAVYGALFVSLVLLPLGAALAVRLGGPSPYRPRCLPVWLIVIEAAGLSALWHILLNPFPVGPFLSNQQYPPVLFSVLALVLAWLVFFFILRKILEGHKDGRGQR